MHFSATTRRGVEAESPKAYLASVTTRLAIDGLRSARHAQTADSRSLAYLHLLEKLSPVERAVFLLREVFDYSYDEIARVVGKNSDNCRQILARAHRHIDEGRRRFEVSREERNEVARRFVAAWADGETDDLVELLAPDATIYGHGGAKGPSARAPLVGAVRVAKALIGWGGHAWQRGFVSRPTLVNGEPGVVFHGPDGRAAWVAALEIADGVVIAVRTVLNPDKLARVPPLGAQEFL